MGFFRKFTGGGNSSGMGKTFLKACLLENLLPGNSTRLARELSPDSLVAEKFEGVSLGPEVLFIEGGDSSRMGERSRRSVLPGSRNSAAA